MTYLLFRYYNTISLSCHGQVWLIRLRFERYFSHHHAENQDVQLMEYALQFYHVKKYDRSSMWSILYQYACEKFPHISLTIELCLSASYSKGGNMAASVWWHFNLSRKWVCKNFNQFKNWDVKDPWNTNISNSSCFLEMFRALLIKWTSFY